MSTNFDYEFIFPTGAFDQTIYNACTIPDNLGTRQVAIQELIVTIQALFNNNALNLHKFSSFIDNDIYRYKVTVTDPTYQ